MILHTQNFVTKQFYYSIKFWPSIGMAMIKATTEDEQDWNTPKRKPWAAEGYEGFLSSDEDAGRTHSQWPTRKYGKNNAGRRR